MAMVGIIANTRQLHIATTLTPGSLEWQTYGKAGRAVTSGTAFTAQNYATDAEEHRHPIS